VPLGGAVPALFCGEGRYLSGRKHGIIEFATCDSGTQCRPDEGGGQTVHYINKLYTFLSESFGCVPRGCPSRPAFYLIYHVGVEVGWFTSEEMRFTAVNYTQKGANCAS